jgi:hypothetical protein
LDPKSEKFTCISILERLSFNSPSSLLSQHVCKSIASIRQVERKSFTFFQSLEQSKLCPFDDLIVNSYTKLHVRTDNMPLIQEPQSEPKEELAEDAERTARIRVKNRRKMYLDQHPSYFTSPDLELLGAPDYSTTRKQTNKHQIPYFMIVVSGDS